VQNSKSSLAALTLGAIGVVYGDIGTSVLYAVKEVFGSGHVPFTPANVYGVLSIFFWTLTVIVSIKYVCCAARRQQRRGRPDRHAGAGLAGGEGQAQLRKVLLAWASSAPRCSTATASSRPAISVLSAVEGLEVVSPRSRTG
jgi:KUP system potassium uptake protein